jgi:outer membrane protein insertion porin family
MLANRAMQRGRRVCSRLLLAVLLSFCVTLPLPAQDQTSSIQPEPTRAKWQTPRTAPQVEEVLPAYEGQKVVAVEVAGRPGLDESQLLPLLVQRKDEPFSMARVEQSIEALKKGGAAKEIELDIRPEPEGIRVIFVLQPAMYFGIYEFPGAERFPYSRLLQVSDYPPRGAYNPTDVNVTQTSVTKFLQQNGYFEAEVHPEVLTDSIHGLVNVVFHVTLRRHAKFGEVILNGAPPPEARALQHDLRSWRARALGAAIRPGKSYSFRTVQKATQYLESQLIRHEYLGSRAQFEGAEYDPSNHRANIHFKVTTGPPVHVKIQGGHVWARTRRKLLPIYQQAGLDPELIQEGRRNLISYFQAKGFFNTQVDSKIETLENGEQVLYFIVKGPRRKVASVEIVGNQTLPGKQLAQQIKVEKRRFPLISHGKFSEQLLKSSANNLKRVYQSEGFSSVEVTPEVSEASGNISVKLRVNEGPRDMVESLQLVGNNAVTESELAPKGLKVVEGQPYSTKKVDEDRNQIVAQYLRMGYLNASFRATARSTGKGSHRLNVTYVITEGPKVMVDSIVTLGRRVTRQSLIDRTVRLALEQPMRKDDLFRGEGRLYNLGVFDWAQIDPRRQITTQTDEDVLVKVHESRLNELKYGFGFEVINRGGSIPSGTVAVPGLPPVFLPSSFKTSEKTFWGPRGTVQYTRRNFRGLGQTISFSGLGARLVQRAAASFGDPYFVGTNWSSTFTLSGERNSENPVFTSRLGDFSFQLQRPMNPDATQQLTLTYSVRQTRLANLLIPALVPPEDRGVRLSGPTVTYSRDTRDNPLDATKGIYETAEFDLNPTALGSNVNFARLRAQAAYYKDVGKKIIWANSLRIGIEQPFAGSHVPVSELFFSGGGSTLRGFPLNGAGPQQQIPACGNASDPSTCALIRVPTGGRELFIVNSEFRIPVPLKKGLGIAAFYDGGNVFEHIGFRDFGSNYTNTIGIGLRYATPVGPVRVDIGHNLNPLSGIKSTQIFITLGQAF